MKLSHAAAAVNSACPAPAAARDRSVEGAGSGTAVLGNGESDARPIDILAFDRDGLQQMIA